MARIRVSTTVDETLLERAPAPPAPGLMTPACWTRPSGRCSGRTAPPRSTVPMWPTTITHSTRPTSGEISRAPFREAASAIVTPLPIRGEVWWCELPEIGRRPVVVLSRDAAIPRLRRALVAPCTARERPLEACRARWCSKPARIRFRVAPPSTWTQSRVSRSPRSCDASGVSATSACARCAPHLPSLSIVASSGASQESATSLLLGGERLSEASLQEMPPHQHWFPLQSEMGPLRALGFLDSLRPPPSESEPTCWIPSSKPPAAPSSRVPTLCAGRCATCRQRR